MCVRRCLLSDTSGVIRLGCLEDWNRPVSMRTATAISQIELDVPEIDLQILQLHISAVHNNGADSRVDIEYGPLPFWLHICSSHLLS